MKQTIAVLEKELPIWMETAVVPGLSIALIHDGELAWVDAFGLADVETQTPVTTNTVFEAASLTKPFFATAVLQLVEEGVLDLDTPLITYLPLEEQQADHIFDHGKEVVDYWFGYVPSKPRLQQLTLRHVLAHTTGFPNWAGAGKPLKFHFAPGSRFSYSGDGFNLVQKIIAQLINQDTETMLQQRLLEPLNMTHSGLTSKELVGLQIASKYDENGTVETPSQWNYFYAAASLQTTALDYGRFLLALINPNFNLLQPQTIAQMWQPQIQVNRNMPWLKDWPVENPEILPNVAWGLGWGLQQNDARTAFWHWGDNGSFKAFALGLPDEGSAIVMFANSKNGDQLWQPILETVFGGNFPALDWIFNSGD